MNVDLAYRFGRPPIGGAAALATRLRAYGVDRIPPEGGVVLALNHFHWIDIPLFAWSNPRSTYFVAKVEAHRVPGLGQFIRLFGTISIRRGESDRDAVRRMREVVRDGNVLGVFVEGTRQRSGVPGEVQPGASLVAVRERVPVVCAAVHGTQTWNLGNLAPCSIAYGEPWSADGLSRDEVSARITRELRTLWEWLVELHAAGRPRHATPPAARGG
ncbi:MAG TPA: lysophospholipid acyltransferase family protein [Gaiellaceae bacterium]|nr:lysophospholipid acyltransferase family protein [Gaiellaceae bacterium]